MKLTFEADVDGQPKPVQMHFGDEADLAELRRWRSPARMHANPHISDALEYARLASKRWAYYHRNGETATGLSQLRFSGILAPKSPSCSLPAPHGSLTRSCSASPTAAAVGVTG